MYSLGLQTAAQRKFLREHPTEKFVASVSVGGGEEEFYTDRAAYIHRLDGVWCTRLALSFRVLKAEEPNEKERMHDYKTRL